LFKINFDDTINITKIYLKLKNTLRSKNLINKVLNTVIVFYLSIFDIFKLVKFIIKTLIVFFIYTYLSKVRKKLEKKIKV
jgi:hypothetical protein